MFGTNPSTNDGSDRVTITDTGVLLIGKTDASTINTVGVEAQNNGLLIATRDSNVPLIANRKTSKGAITQFRADNTVVGQIGVETSNYLYVGSGDTNLAFSAANDLIFPRGTEGAQRDAAIDLGNSSNRFKDLYLSGGVNFGGAVNSNGNVSSSNTLDDYEEGTWTPDLQGLGFPYASATFTLRDAHYIKIGNICHAFMDIYNVNKNSMVGNVVISGLPFANDGMMQNVAFTNTDVFTFDEEDRTISGVVVASTLLLRKGIGRDNVFGSDFNTATNGNIIMSITYMTT